MRIFSEDFSTPQEQAVLKIACENSLKAFIKVIHYYNNGSKFTFKPFHDEVIKALEDRVLNGNPKNLILNLPVGFGKSQIVEYFIDNFTKENDTILDCFMGLGTTGIEAKRKNRNFIGVELVKEYFDIAKKRIKEIK